MQRGSEGGVGAGMCAELLCCRFERSGGNQESSEQTTKRTCSVAAMLARWRAMRADLQLITADWNSMSKHENYPLGTCKMAATMARWRAMEADLLSNPQCLQEFKVKSTEKTCSVAATFARWRAMRADLLSIREVSAVSMSCPMMPHTLHFRHIVNICACLWPQPSLQCCSGHGERRHHCCSRTYSNPVERWQLVGSNALLLPEQGLLRGPRRGLQEAVPGVCQLPCRQCSGSHSNDRS